jgi:hypothetical protein
MGVLVKDLIGTTQLLTTCGLTGADPYGGSASPPSARLAFLKLAGIQPLYAPSASPKSEPNAQWGPPGGRPTAGVISAAGRPALRELASLARGSFAVVQPAYASWLSSCSSGR